MGSLWDEFSEFLPENRVPTSADFNTYPIRIFVFLWSILKKEKSSFLNRNRPKKKSTV